MTEVNEKGKKGTRMMTGDRTISLRSFTEAVPLSLSSMAHDSLPLEDGVLDGMKQLIHHTLMACVQYARAMYSPYQWTYRDLVTSKHAWKAVKTEVDLPNQITKLGFKYQYVRNCMLYLTPNGTTIEVSQDVELQEIENWVETQSAALAKISLIYVSTELLTLEEMNSIHANDLVDDDDDHSEKSEDDDIPATLLYKVAIEYRSVPSTGSVVSLQAEELSMLSFGGSVDDDVKFGALASLHDKVAKYVLEIYSVRGKKYKFDLMNGTLSDGALPSLVIAKVPFAKSLCVTVTDHTSAAMENVQGKDETEKSQYAVTVMNLTLEGQLQLPFLEEQLPSHTKCTEEILNCFPSLNPRLGLAATSYPSRHMLLLEPEAVGKVYVNGKYITTWGSDPTIGSHTPALFGCDLMGIPNWQGRIIDYEAMMMEYSKLWQEALIDASLDSLNIANKLLHRLMGGQDEYEEYYDDANSAKVDTSQDCLESQIMANPKYDPVGIAAKALATRFAVEYGKAACPCLAHEVEWIQARAGDRVPIVVPLRLLAILRRGGYFNTQHLVSEQWEFGEPCPKSNEGFDKQVINNAVELLKQSGCNDVTNAHISFVDSKRIATLDPFATKCMCRYDESFRQYHVNNTLLTMDLPSPGDDDNATHEALEEANHSDTSKEREFLLGMYVAQEHPDGCVLVRYLLRHSKV